MIDAPIPIDDVQPSRPNRPFFDLSDNRRQCCFMAPGRNTFGQEPGTIFRTDGSPTQKQLAYRVRGQVAHDFEQLTLTILLAPKRCDTHEYRTACLTVTGPRV